MFSGLNMSNHKEEDINPLDGLDGDLPEEILDSHNNALVQDACEIARVQTLSSICSVMSSYGITPELAAVLATLSPNREIASPLLVAGWGADQRLREGKRLSEMLTTHTLATEAFGISKDNIKSALMYHKKLILASAAVVAGLVSLRKGISPGRIGATQAIVAAVAGAELYAANKIVNHASVYGSYDAASATLSEMSERDDLIKKLQSLPIPKTDAEYPTYANALKPVTDALASYGYLLSDTYVSFKRDRINPATKFKLEKFADSGWSPDNFKHLSIAYKKVTEQIEHQAPILARVLDAYDRAKGTVRGEEAAVMVSKLIACLMADQAADAKLVVKSLASAGKFFSVKQLRVVAE